MAGPVRSAAWSDTLPKGQDVIGAGFPDYIGDATEPGNDGLTDFERGLKRLGQDPLGGAAKALGSIVTDPFGTMAKGAGTLAADAVSFTSPLIMKLAIGGLGVILLIFGLWGLMKGGPIAQGIAEGYRNARDAA